MREVEQKESPFRNVVFAGGGSRCVWQVGFWQVVAPEIGLKPKTIAAVSAGAAMASFLVGGCEEAAMHHFGRRMESNEKNFYWRHLFSRQKAAFPQAAIYRGALLDTYDKETFAKIQSGPEIRILLAHPPRWTGAMFGALLGLLSYKVEKKMVKPVHPGWNKKMGFRPVVLSSKLCETAEELADMVLQSSCTPPFTPLMKRDGQLVLDGGLVDNVPVLALGEEVQEGRTLVLLSRQYGQVRLLGEPSRVYVQPSGPAPVSTWDYTNPEGLRQTYEMGKRDAEVFLRQFEGS